MVSSWLPDPPLGRSSDDISPISVPAAFIDSDTDDQESNNEENSLENGGYLPLNDNDNPLDDDSEDTEDETSDVTSQSIPDSSDPDNTANGTSVSIPVLDHNDIETAEPRDIDVDCEQVRAIMARVTLPASATPSWASAMPDSEWCTFLQDRIRTLQGRSELLPESKN